MAKKVTGIIKLQIPAGQANPAPPVGPALGQHGVNIMGFCKEFNAATKGDAGLVIPVVITVYQDKSFTFITKSPPASVLLPVQQVCPPSDGTGSAGSYTKVSDRPPDAGASSERVPSPLRPFARPWLPRYSRLKRVPGTGHSSAVRHSFLPMR